MISKYLAAVLTLMAAIIGGTQRGVAQSLPDSTKSRIDNIFKRWDTAGSPGCVVGIVRNDSLIYAKGYGLANVENNIPNTPQTEYYICSLAKQFAGYAVVLLAREGKLRLDDDLRIYLPWMPDFGHKITIRNLLHHTSGLRDEADMAVMAGLPLEGMLTQKRAIEIIKRQRTLNFVPGERYAYSNSNYVLLAEIVKVASGKEFPAYTADAIFSPLGMTHTAFMDDSRNIIMNRAAPYSTDRKNMFQYANVLGAGSLFTSMEDMARWAINFYSPRVGDANDIQQLAEKGRLNNGKENDYALGISVDSSRGWIMYSHNGSLAGYVTQIRVYPELKTGIIVFSNTGDARVFNTTRSIAELLIPDHSRKTDNPSNTRPDSSTAGFKNPAALKPIEGDYLAANGFTRSFSVKGDRLYMNKDILMAPATGDTICEWGYPDIKYVFHITAKDTTIDFYHPQLMEPQPLRFVKLVKGLQLPDDQLKAYTGVYYSHELLCTYEIQLKDHQLYFASSIYPDSKITMMGKDDLLSDYRFFSHVRMLRSKDGQITGFEVSNESTRNLKFDKIE